MRCQPRHVAQQRAVEPKEDAQPLRHGEDKLAVGDGRADFRREPFGEDQRPLLVAGGADAALFAGESDEEMRWARTTSEG